MKLIIAIIRPEKLGETLEALYRAEVRGLTVSGVQGHGGEVERVETYRGTTVKMGLQEKVRLEIGVSEPFVDVTVRAILDAACTGSTKIFPSPTSPVSALARIAFTVTSTNGSDTPISSRTFSCSPIFTVVPR